MPDVGRRQSMKAEPPLRIVWALSFLLVFASLGARPVEESAVYFSGSCPTGESLPFGVFLTHCDRCLALTSQVDRGGALSVGVVTDSAADRAGFLPGDCVIEVAGTAIRSAPELTAAARAHAGRKTLIRFVRDGYTWEREVTLAVG